VLDCGVSTLDGDRFEAKREKKDERVRSEAARVEQW
jgi:hypothetical protein